MNIIEEEMATQISVVDEQREPLLFNSSLHLPPQELTDGKGEEIVTSEPPKGLADPIPNNPGGSPPRLVSLDVFRGLTVAVRFKSIIFLIFSNRSTGCLNFLVQFHPLL